MIVMRIRLVVNQDKKALALALREGLSRLKATGEFLALQQKYGVAKPLDSSAIELINPYFSGD